jgi:hypothetical protein
MTGGASDEIWTVSVPVGWLGADAVEALAEDFEAMAHSRRLPDYKRGFARHLAAALRECASDMHLAIDQLVEREPPPDDPNWYRDGHGVDREH